MAQLSEARRDEVAASVHRQLSRRFHPIDITKAQVRSGIAVFDENLETCEGNILSSVGPNAQTWLQNNPTVARYILEMVAQKRREEL